jgi:molybdopterin molybdotransferase
MSEKRQIGQNPNPRFFDVRMRGFRDRTDVMDAYQSIDELTSLLPPEREAALECTSRVLSQAIVALLSIPPFDRSAMDGYAVCAEDTFGADSYNPVTLTMIGESMPGKGFFGTVSSGNAVRIMTGAPIPTGANAVIQAEATEEEGNQVRIREPITPRRHIGRVGEDIKKGETVLEGGRILRPQDIGLLSAMGISSVEVFRKPRVQILITGNEILQPGAKPQGYQIVDSNSPMIHGLILRDQGIPLETLYLQDQRESIREALLQSQADVVLISGGSSVGKEDFAPSVVGELGKLIFHGVALRPASPTGFGVIDKKLIFLLPGNPVSCLCAYDLFVSRAIRKMGGLPFRIPYPQIQRPVANKIVSAIGRIDYVRVRITENGIDPVAVSGASILSTTVISDGFILVDRDREGYAPGEMVLVYLYDGLLSKYWSS